MNAAEYLKKSGWRGEGFSLDTADRGLTKRLLSQRKDGSAGLGANAHDYSNQWWLRSFDQSLRAVGRSDSSNPTLHENLHKPAGLYSGFVRGEVLSSTIKARRCDEAHSSDTSDNLQPQMAPSMSTVHSGFILGEPLAPTNATAVSTPATFTKERKSKKRRHDVDPASGDVSAGPGMAENNKEKKRKLERKGGILQDEMALENVQRVNGASAASQNHETALYTSTEKQKKKRTHRHQAVEVENGDEEKETIAVKGERKRVRQHADTGEDSSLGSEAIRIAHSTDLSGTSGVTNGTVPHVSYPTEDAKLENDRKRDNSGAGDSGNQVIPPILVAGPSTESKVYNSDEIFMNSVSVTAGSANIQGDSAPQFISLGIGGEQTTEKPQKNSKAKKSKRSGAGQQLYIRPDGTIDPFAIDPATAPGGKKFLHIPTVHPKTGKALTKKARRIIAKKLVKKEKKVTREAVRERRAAKKAKRIQQNALKEQAKEAAPKKPSKSEKYAREKAKRVAKREAKARMTSTVGTGANSTPIAQ